MGGLGLQGCLRENFLSALIRLDDNWILGNVRITDLPRSCSVPVEAVSTISRSSIKVSYHILVHTPRLGLRGRDRNASLCSIVQEVGPSLEPLKKIGIPPRRNNLNTRLDCIKRQFEPDTIIS